MGNSFVEVQSPEQMSGTLTAILGLKVIIVTALLWMVSLAVFLQNGP